MDDIFSKFRNESLSQLRSLRPEDINLFDEKPIEEIITIVVRPPEKNLKALTNLMHEFKLVDPGQFYYPPDFYHATILGKINSGYDEAKLISAVKESVYGLKMEFRLFGLASNGFCSSVSAYPINFSMKRLRDKLRNLLKVEADDYTKTLSTYEHMCWINFLRYKVIPDKSFLDKILSYSETEFGTMRPKTLQIYKTKSKVIDPRFSKLIFSLDLF